MKLVVQRVLRAEVRADLGSGELETVGRVGHGMVVLVCAMAGDRPEDARRLAERLAQYRFFEDPDGRTNCSALEVGAGALVISQFTLAADGQKGRRPSFDRAAKPDQARTLFELFTNHLRDQGVPVETGAFGQYMQVELIGDGPATYQLQEPKAQ